MRGKILVIDDETSIRRLLRLTLESEGHIVVEARDAREGLHFAVTERPDAIVLDMGLPDKRGDEVLKDLRAFSQVPVLILSVESDPDTIVNALDLGADDYVTKPFRGKELLARLRVSLRRSLQATSPMPLISFADVTVDLEKRLVHKAGVLVKLTATEYDLLVLFIKNRGKVLTHRHILRQVWGPHAPTDSSYPRVYVRHLRAKLETIPEEPTLFQTEPGVGYRLID